MSLLGLLQLYFLIEGLLDRLTYLAFALLALTVSVGVVAVTVVTSVTGGKGRAEYLYAETDSVQRREIFGKLLAEEAEMRRLTEKCCKRVREVDELMALRRQVHRAHEAAERLASS